MKLYHDNSLSRDRLFCIERPFHAGSHCLYQRRYSLIARVLRSIDGEEDLLR